jgi:hypothetical protein
VPAGARQSATSLTERRRLPRACAARRLGRRPAHDEATGLIIRVDSRQDVGAVRASRRRRRGRVRHVVVVSGKRARARAIRRF